MVSAERFLKLIIDKYKPSVNSIIHIADIHSKIIASTDELLVGGQSADANYILNLERPSTIDIADENTDNEHSQSGKYGEPVYLNGNLWGAIIIKSNYIEVEKLGYTIRIAVESALDLVQYVQSTDNVEDRLTVFIGTLLERDVDADDAISFMKKLKIDPYLCRSVILIELEYEKKYSNININVGGQSSIENSNQQVMNLVKSNQYLNSNDFCIIYGEKYIVLIKSFNSTSDIAKTYIALDKICRDIAASLEIMTDIKFKLAYGNLYASVADVHRSYSEAKSIIEVASKGSNKSGFLALDNILFDSVYQSLPSQVIEKIIKPTLKKLNKKNGNIKMELLECAELYVDCCMSISVTAQKGYIHRNTIASRLRTLTELTGLDPIHKFNDAFMIKMLATYMRINQKST